MYVLTNRFPDNIVTHLPKQYVSIIGVVFATIWTRKQNWNPKDAFGDHDHGLQRRSGHHNLVFDPTINMRSAQLSTLQFQRTEESTSTDDEIEGEMNVSPMSSGGDLEKGNKT